MFLYFNIWMYLIGYFLLVLIPPLSSSSDSSLLQDNVAFVLCLDTLGNGDTMHLHVSKPPKEGSPQFTLLKELELVRRSTLYIILYYIIT